MKHILSAAIVSVALFAFGSQACGLTLPVSEDTAYALGSSAAQYAGKATTLPVSSEYHALVRFKVGSFSDTVDAANVRSARLIIYFCSITKPGSFTLHKVTQNWSEKYAGRRIRPPNYDPAVVATVSAGVEMGKQFVVIDVTASVKGWLAAPESDFGFALIGANGAMARIGAKEGPGVGYPATLEIENADLDPVPAATVELPPDITLAGTTTGRFRGNLEGTASSANSVGGLAAGMVSSGVNLANSATNINLPGSIVLRDPSGSFSAATISGAFVGNGAGLSGVTAINGVSAASLTNINTTFMEFVRVANPGNADDVVDADLLSFGIQRTGGVNQTYLIGKYEVTNTQYTQFLNAVAATDVNDLYDVRMVVDPRAGIMQSGNPGSFTYALKPNMGNKPVIWISFYDAIRFCNWIHNGMPTGPQNATTTEDGAYLLIEENYPSTFIVRKEGAKVFLPSESQWYKAAYYDPTKNGTGGYYRYPTRSDNIPILAKADANGNINNPSSNVANFNFGAGWNAQTGNVTAVGSGGPGTESAYGAADMGGNVFEWTDSIRDFESRILRGGSWGSWLTEENDLQSSTRYSGDPSVRQDNIGFRVARP